MKLLLNLHAHPLQMPVEETKYSYSMLKDILTNNFKLVKHLLFTNIDESHNVCFKVSLLNFAVDLHKTHTES